METTIYFYRENEQYGELSNFYPLDSNPIIYQGKSYPTSEHLYQALKYLTHPYATDRHIQYAELIRTTNTPNKSKILANKRTALTYQWQRDLKMIIDQFPEVDINPEWESIKDEMMTFVLKMKFNSHPHCKHVLKSTRNAKLTERTIKDNYWADGGDGSGKNMLGKLLMKVRDEL